VKKTALIALALAVAAVVWSATAFAASPKPVTVVMRDPGCHWFAVNGKYLTKLSVAGPVSLFNTDEAALRIVGNHLVKLAPVGKKLALARGTYHITMVGQAPDDNHLTLVVK
jgi:hypothetical protein